MLLAAGAGALASGWDGGALRPPANADVLAAAPAAYSELRALTAQSARESTQKAGAFAKRFYPLAKRRLCAPIFAFFFCRRPAECTLSAQSAPAFFAPKARGRQVSRSRSLIIVRGGSTPCCRPLIAYLQRRAGLSTAAHMNCTPKVEQESQRKGCRNLWGKNCSVRNSN